LQLEMRPRDANHVNVVSANPGACEAVVDGGERQFGFGRDAGVLLERQPFERDRCNKSMVMEQARGCIVLAIVDTQNEHQDLCSSFRQVEPIMVPRIDGVNLAGGRPLPRSAPDQCYSPIARGRDCRPAGQNPARLQSVAQNDAIHACGSTWQRRTAGVKRRMKSGYRRRENAPPRSRKRIGATLRSRRDGG
jgi:hypothetical protein